MIQKSNDLGLFYRINYQDFHRILIWKGLQFKEDRDDAIQNSMLCLMQKKDLWNSIVSATEVEVKKLMVTILNFSLMALRKKYASVHNLPEQYQGTIDGQCDLNIDDKIAVEEYMAYIHSFFPDSYRHVAKVCRGRLDGFDPIPGSNEYRRDYECRLRYRKIVKDREKILNLVH